MDENSKRITVEVIAALLKEGRDFKYEFGTDEYSFACSFVKHDAHG